MKKILSAVLFIAVSKLSLAQRLTIEQYVATYKQLAIQEMKRTGIPASITLAQGILEAEAGNSDLVKRSNNHFGIKCKTGWTGETVSHDDDALQECFRKYSTAYDSYIDHSNFLKNSSRYAPLFTLSPKDYQAWARGLKKAGYATNPRYADILISNIEKYSLHVYDAEGEMAAIPEDMAVVENAVIVKEGKAETVAIPSQTVGFLPEANVPGVKTKFNGIKATFAKKGTSLLALASQFGVKLGKLLEYNDLPDDGILADDQVIYLERKNKEGHAATYTTSTTESLRNISQNLGIQLAALKEFNNVQPDDALATGTTIYLKPKS